MPTKGPSRGHEAFRLQTPGQAAASEPDLIEVPDAHDEPGWNDVTDTDDVPAPRTTRRTYRGDLVYVEMENVTAVRDRLRTDAGFSDGVTVELPGDVQVSMPLWFSRQAVVGGLGHGSRHRILVSEGSTDDDASTCSCGRDRCGHRSTAVEAVRALVEARRVRSGVRDWEATSSRVRTLWGAEHAAMMRDRARADRPPPDGPDWSDDRTAFQQSYRAARDAHAAGDNPIPYMTADATDGLGARDGGRGFGVEIEFDVPGSPGTARHRGALAAIANDLHDAGIIDSPRQTGYHQGRGDFSRWRFEHDVTVDGEIVSPILYDEPETWNKIATVCDIVERHGGTASMRTGGHVHVSVGDYDHTPENHQQLLQLFDAHQDTLYRLSHNSDQRTHRGTAWCQPNRVPSRPYSDSGDYQAHFDSHRVAVNFGAVSGRHTDHVEFRTWDGSLDPATIQTRIKMSLALADHAFRNAGAPAADAQPLGSHRTRNRALLQRGQRLRGEAWRVDTANFRSLMDTVFRRVADREQATALFAITRWQRR